jgi:predicted PurR-regulated permease PerM
MLRKVWNNPYAKTTLSIIFTGSVLLLVNRMVRGTDFEKALSTFNATMAPVYIGIVLAFLLCPIYNKIVRWIYPAIYKDGKAMSDNFGSMAFGFKVPKNSKKTPAQRAFTQARMIATILCLALVIAIVSLISTAVLPSVLSSIMDLINTLPQRMQNLFNWGSVRLAKYPPAVKLLKQITEADTTEIIAWVQKHLLNNDFRGIAETLSSSVFATAKAVINIFVGLLISVYLLNYKEKLFAIGRKVTSSLFTQKSTLKIYEFFEIINDTFIGFIIGRIIDACIIGVLTYVCMLLLGLPMPELISVIVGVTNVIPFFGPFLGAIPSACLILLVNPMQCLYFCIMILIIQQLDGNVIGPKVVGSVIGLNSFWVLIAVILGGGFFGFFGMALGVPVFAVIYRYANINTCNRLRRRDQPEETWEYLDYSKYNIDKEDLEKHE